MTKKIKPIDKSKNRVEERTEEIEVAVEHPIEAVFDIEEGSTLFPQTQVNTEMVIHETYDEKDIEIEEQFQEIYDVALSAYTNQAEEAEFVDAQYRARNQEVAVQYLNAALNAAKEKAALKQLKDKLEKDGGAGGPRTVNNNLIIDRNELLRTLLAEEDNKPKDEPIDVTPEEL